jgi:nickel-dependent lactate racemase
MTDPTPKQPTEPIDSTRLREEVRKKVDAWIASQPEPRPTRSEAIERLLAEALAREAAARARRE